jgi:GMP synthase (glutamine-hydrolysing)
MNKIIIIKTGISKLELPPERGDFEDWIIESIKANYDISFEVINVLEGEDFPDTSGLDGIIITGSYSMITDHEPWSEKCARWLREDIFPREIPSLGICYGHQLHGYAEGAEVGVSDKGAEFGTLEVILNEEAEHDPLFSNLNSPLTVQFAHHQSVMSLPHNAVVLGSTEKDPHSIIRIGRCNWGVQFHPEYDAEISNACIKSYNDRIETGEVTGTRLPLNAREAESGKEILRLFTAFVLQEKMEKV